MQLNSGPLLRLLVWGEISVIFFSTYSFSGMETARRVFVNRCMRIWQIYDGWFSSQVKFFMEEYRYSWNSTAPIQLPIPIMAALLYSLYINISHSNGFYVWLSISFVVIQCTYTMYWISSLHHLPLVQFYSRVRTHRLLFQFVTII